MKFDLISDVHLDGILQEGESVEDFVNNIMVKNPSKYIVFAGDFGYYNEQNIEFLKELKKHYEAVLFVYGNNDLKLPLFDNREGYKDVKERVIDFELKIRELDNVYRLDGTTVTLDGVTFGGCDLFYDFDNLRKLFDATEEQLSSFWIKANLHKKHIGWIREPEEYAENEKRKLKKILPKADVIITHGPPDYFYKEGDYTIGMFRFDGDDIKDSIKGKTWCFGHQHLRFNEERYGCRFVNATYKGVENPKIYTVEI